MKKIICLLISALFFATPYVNASVIRGKHIYIKKLKDKCGFKGNVMGAKHSIKEWRELYRKNLLSQEIYKLCPKADSVLKKKDLKHLYQFLKTFANDSGNIPSCN